MSLEQQGVPVSRVGAKGRVADWMLDPSLLGSGVPGAQLLTSIAILMVRVVTASLALVPIKRARGRRPSAESTQLRPP